MTRVLIAYASLSGNTSEVAEIIGEEFSRHDISIEYFRIWDGSGTVEPSEYDAMILGSYTWDLGTTPDEVKEFVADIGYKPEPVYVFGTGDTQFGGVELFCAATVKLAGFYDSPAEPLLVEQSPRGSQERKVREWAKGVLRIERNLTQS